MWVWSKLILDRKHFWKQAYCSWYFQNVIDMSCFNLTKMTSYIEYLIPTIFSNYKNRSPCGPWACIAVGKHCEDRRCVLH